MNRLETIFIKSEIKELYEKIIAHNNIKGDQDEKEKQVMKIIKSFTDSDKNNICSVCGKPNWQQLFKDFKMKYELDFVKDKCAFCTANVYKKDKYYISNGDGSGTWYDSKSHQQLTK